MSRFRRNQLVNLAPSLLGIALGVSCSSKSDNKKEAGSTSPQTQAASPSPQTQDASTASDSTPDPSVDPQVAALFGQFRSSIQKNCVACHGGDGTPFPSIVSFAGLADVKSWVNHPLGLIVPGDPLKSPIYNRTTHANGKVPPSIQTNMPFAAGTFGSSSIPDADGQAIFDFVVATAVSSGPQPGQPPSTASLVSPAAASLSKAKYIAHGGAPTADELKAVTNTDGNLNREELRKLISQWLLTSPGKTKLEDFFRLTLDQNDFEYPGDDGEAIFGRWRKVGAQTLARWLAPLQESFIRTAMDIVSNGRPFTEIVTSNRQAVTSSLLASYSFADGAGRLTGFNSKSEKFSQFVQTMTDADFSDWRFVNLQKNSSVIAFNEMDKIRAVAESGTYNLKIPRVGFFNTLAFQLKNTTNVDNDFRVSISQTLIVALHRIFEAGDSTPSGDLSALDSVHAAPGTACYSCHRLMDPMREVFRTTYTTDYLYSDGSQAKTSAFAFAGISGPSKDVQELANTISKHPDFALGWVSKVCAYANSEPCDETEASFVQAVENFKRSNYSFLNMIADILSSPVVTMKGVGLAENTATVVPLAQRGLVSLSRKNHFCHAMDTRYREVLASKERVYNLSASACDLSQPAIQAAASLPEDKVLRGSQKLIQSKVAEPFAVIGFESVCKEMARELVSSQNTAGFDCCSTTALDASFDDMTRLIIGLPSNHPRYNAAKATLKDFYTRVQQTASITELAALRETFVLACISPDILGVGL